MPGGPARGMLRYVAVIEVSELTKRYGREVAVDGISFTVEEGEIFGILGPNGAGKTTAVECVAGLQQPDSGPSGCSGWIPGPRRRRCGSGWPGRSTTRWPR